MPSQELLDLMNQMRIARKTPDWLYPLQPGAVKRAGEYEMFLALLAKNTTAGWIAMLGGEPIIVEPKIDIQVVERVPLKGIVWAKENNGMPNIIENGGRVTVVRNSFPESNTMQDIAISLFFLTFD